MIGVFIGIQFSNWNDARRHEKSERVYIERIREDLLANQDDLRQRLSYFHQTRAHALATLDALDRPTDSLGVQFLIDAYQSSQITALPANCAPELDTEAVSLAVAAVANGEVRNDLVRRISDLDGKLSAAQLIIDRARLLDDYLARVHQ